MNRSLRRRHQHHQLKREHHQVSWRAAPAAAPRHCSQAALAAQADTNIKHIIIQWIIRCNQSALKHHKSKPAEPKRSGRLDKGQHRLSTQWASSTALSPIPPSVVIDTTSQRLVSRFRFTCNTLARRFSQFCASAFDARVARKVHVEFK